MGSAVAASVVIPAHNAAKWIGETLASVASQTCGAADLELIVVDDGSRDGTVAVAREAVERWFPRGQVVQLPMNRGVSAARNVGWRCCTGDWVQFLDADDLLGPGKLAAQLEVVGVLPQEVGAVWSPWRRLDLTDAGWQAAGPLQDPIIGADAITDVVRAHFGYVGPMLFRRAALDCVGGFREGIRLGEDQDLCLRLIRAGFELKRVGTADPAYYYRTTPGNASGVLIGDASAVRAYFEAVQEAEAWVRDRCGGALSTSQRAAFIACYDARLGTLYDGDPAAFRRIYAHLLSLDPDYLPIARGRLRALSKVVGYERAERVGSLARGALRLGRQAAIRTGLRDKTSQPRE
jgi:glycosyltransferase involved in cell wall biosynthesis